MKKFLALLAVLTLVFQPSLLFAEGTPTAPAAEKKSPEDLALEEEEDLDDWGDEDWEEDADFELDEEEEEGKKDKPAPPAGQKPAPK